MHTVALRREVMGPLGTELIRWAEYYIAPVRAYAAVSSANILQLVLPSDGKYQGMSGAMMMCFMPRDIQLNKFNKSDIY